MSFCRLQHCRSPFWQVKPSYYMLQVRRLHLRLNQPCTVISVKRSIGIHPTKTNKHYKLQQHICAAFQTKLKLHHAQRSSATQIKFAQLRDGKNLMWPTCHLHSCAMASSWGLIVPINSQITWLHLFKLHAGWFQGAGWFLCCPR